MNTLISRSKAAIWTKAQSLVFLKRYQFGIFELLHRFSIFFWLKNFFLDHIKKSLLNFVEKNALILVNLKSQPHPVDKSQFSLGAIDRIQFFNYSDIPTCPRKPVNKN